MPVLLVDGEPIIDSTAIMTYLADKHGGMTFAAGTLERARQDALTQFILDEIDAILWTAARHTFILPEVKTSRRWEFERSVSVLMDRMGDGPFLMGEMMTIPDIIASHFAGWAIASKFPVRDAYKAYSKRLSARAAHARALQG